MIAGMKAAVLYETGRPLRIEEVQLSPPRAGEVLVRMAPRASVTAIPRHVIDSRDGRVRTPCSHRCWS